jgi:hypothetical protein
LSTIEATSTLWAGAAGADDGAAVDPVLGAAPLAGAPAGAAVALEPKIAPMIFPKMLIVCSQFTRDGVKGWNGTFLLPAAPGRVVASLATALCLPNEAFTEA